MNEALDFLMGTNVALAAGILLVLVVRVPARRLFGPRVAYALWLLPLLMAGASRLPAPQTAATSAAVAPTIAASPLEALVRAVPRIPRLTIEQLPAVSRAPRDTAWPPLPTMLLMIVWTVGCVTSVSVLARRQRRLLTALGALRRAYRDDAWVFYSENRTVGPALVGVLRPRVILPADFDARFTADEQPLVLAHELVHLRSWDAQVNAVVAIVRVVCWFNPLVHFAASLVRFDQELACDAAVVARQPGSRRHYAEAMLKAQLAAEPLALGCGWVTSKRHPLRRRISALGSRPPGRVRRWAGVVVAAGLVWVSSYTAWATQPATTTTATTAAASTSSRASGPGSRGMLAELPKMLLPWGSHVLLDAVSEDDVKAVQALIADGADVNAYRPGDGTPLVEAARRGNLALASLLIDHGADPNKAAPGDGNPLIMAAARGHEPIVQLLVERGADVNGYVPGDETPLINAAARGHLAVVKYLVEEGADVNLAFDVATYQGGTERRSPLGQAIKFKHDEVASYLRAAGASQ
jgi:beta-lactamase regulating signal transducer with metallopeptidase domain/ankyrin repeat protein